MTEKNRPSFGWLLLGMGWGLLAGHAMVTFGLLLLLQFPPREFARWCLYAMLCGAMLGIGGGVPIDSCAKRSTTWMDWVLFGGAVA